MSVLNGVDSRLKRPLFFCRECGPLWPIRLEQRNRLGRVGREYWARFEGVVEEPARWEGDEAALKNINALRRDVLIEHHHVSREYSVVVRRSAAADLKLIGWLHTVCESCFASLDVSVNGLK